MTESSILSKRYRLILVSDLDWTMVPPLPVLPSPPGPRFAHAIVLWPHVCMHSMLSLPLCLTSSSSVPMSYRRPLLHCSHHVSRHKPVTA